MVAVGEKFLIQAIEEQCIIHQDDPSGRLLFDMDSLIILMRMLGFISSSADRSEMKAWLMNN
jgi:hypothetical protein